MSPAALVYAFALGLVAVLNPCGFPLLPAYLGVFIRPDEGALPFRMLRALKTAASMTAGFVAVFAVAGLAAAAGIRIGLAWIPVFTALLGLVLLVVGVFGVAGRTVSFPVFAIRFGSGRGVLAMAGYGAAFALVSLGCAFPLFVAAVAPATADRSVLAAAAASLGYALGMGLFVAACSVLTAIANAEAVRVLGRLSRYLPRAGSALLLAVGVYLLAYGTRLIVSPGREPALGASVAQLSSAATTAVEAHPLVFGSVAAAVVVAALIAVASAVHRTRHHDQERP